MTSMATTAPTRPWTGPPRSRRATSTTARSRSTAAPTRSSATSSPRRCWGCDFFPPLPACGEGHLFTVIPGRDEVASYDVQLHIRESITTAGDYGFRAWPLPSRLLPTWPVEVAELG